MRILVFEFVCGGGCFAYPSFGSPKGPLYEEGKIMLKALLEEIDNVENLKAVVPIDKRCAGLAEELNAECSTIHAANDLFEFFHRAANTCDQAILIAPEIDNALFHLTRRFETQFEILCPGSNVVAMCSDKWSTHQFLKDERINTPATMLAEEFLRNPQSKKIVIKPRLGAGGIKVGVLDSSNESRADAQSNAVDYLQKHCLAQNETLVQEFGQGLPASIAVWNTGNELFFFPAMQQCFDGGSFTFSHALGPLENHLQERANFLMQSIVDSLPDFLGYLGADLILGRDEIADDSVVDINPRMTTSFCQTRKLIPPGRLEDLILKTVNQRST